MRKTFTVVLALGLLAPVYPIFAEESFVPPSWTTVYDFMVQDVCTDKEGKILVGISPLTNACILHRNIRPGEALSYHKADWPNKQDINSFQNGYQRSDSFPFNPTTLGILVVQTFDFGNGGRKFGEFDKGDGGQLVAFSKNSASIILTEDGGAGLQLMAGRSCKEENVSPSSLLDSWLISEGGANNLVAGESVATLKIVTRLRCPLKFDLAYTKWYFKDLSYRISIDGARSNPLLTLVSSHFGGGEQARADHLERFYFTRELGWTRWERWQNTEIGTDAAGSRERGQKMAASERCVQLEPPPSASWVMQDCREWSNIIKPDSPAGDKPNFWIDRLIKDPLSRSIFVN